MKRKAKPPTALGREVRQSSGFAITPHDVVKLLEAERDGMIRRALQGGSLTGLGPVGFMDIAQSIEHFDLAVRIWRKYSTVRA